MLVNRRAKDSIKKTRHKRSGNLVTRGGGGGGGERDPGNEVDYQGVHLITISDLYQSMCSCW